MFKFKFFKKMSSVEFKILIVKIIFPKQDLDEDRQNRARLRIAAAAKSPYSGTCVLKLKKNIF